MISHNEAQTLISARQDQVLDPLVERELNAHLATCDACRAFAQTTDALTQGLRTLPYLPASPAVRDAVMGRVEQGRSPFARLATAFNGTFNTAPGPALSTLAIIALVLIVGFFALNRFVLQDNGGNDPGPNQQLASQPTEQARATETAEATEEVVNLVAEETPEPTATEGATEAAATEDSAAVATEEPTPTETQAPEPTATTAPEPTATEEPEPTATEPPAPTATTEPEPTVAEGDGVGGSQASTTMLAPSTPVDEEPTEEPVDLTTEAATAEVTEEPIATATEAATPPPSPTATATATAPATVPATPEPTIAPTATPTATATATTAPTATPTVEPTPEPTAEPTEAEAPPIVPIDGGEPEEEVADPTEESEPAEPGEEPTPEEIATQEDDGQTIEPMDDTQIVEPTDETPETEAAVTPEDESATETPQAAQIGPVDGTEAQETRDLAEASELYQDIAGEGDRLLLTSEGRLEFGTQPHAPSLVTASGRVLQTIDAEGGTAVGLCDDGGACTDVSSGSREGAATDSPVGVSGGDVIYMRSTDAGVEYRRASVEGETVLEDVALLEGDASIASQGTVFEATDRFWIPTASGDWVVLDEGEGSVLPSDFASPQLTRFAGSSENPMIGYVSGGQLIIAPAMSPGSASVVIPFSGTDFDMSPQGDQVAISTGSSIDIYDMSGALVTSYTAEDVTPGTLLWLNGGIVYLDTSSGALYQVPQTGI